MSILQGINTGYRIGTDIADRIAYNREAPLRAARESRAVDQNRRAEETHQMRIQDRQVEFQAYQREMAREATEDNKNKTMMRLAMQAAFVQAMQDGGDTYDMQEQFAGQYLDVLNEQEQDLIDVHGDGRRVSGVHQMPNGRFVFEVEGGDVDGKKPITRNRGTAEDGDDIVDSMDATELAQTHFGQMQAFSQKFPDMAAVLQDPKRREAQLKFLMNMHSALGGKAPDMKQANALELEGAKQKNREKNQKTKTADASALIGERHEKAVKLKQTPSASGASGGLKMNDKLKQVVSMAKTIREELQEQGYGYEDDKPMPTDKEIMLMAQERLTTAVSAAQGELEGETFSEDEVADWWDQY